MKARTLKNESFLQSLAVADIYYSSATELNAAPGRHPISLLGRGAFLRRYSGGPLRSAKRSDVAPPSKDDAGRQTI